MFDNSGYAAFANSLSNAGAAFGNALQERNRRQSLAELGQFAANNDYAGLSKAAFAMGDERLGLSALAMDQEQKKIASQRAADDAALGVAGGTAQGGVTVNPNPQPMMLPGGLPANDEISQYIVQSAKQRGIDPGIALKVYRSEGAGGYAGDKNSSFGPFQLHYGGVAPGGNAVAGLGDEFTKATGLDARNPSTWKQQVDFALEKAKSGGWGPWHGWKGDQWAGIRGVQVADASGRIPDNVFQQPPQATPVDGLMARRENIMRALNARGISDNARAQLNTMLQATEKDIDRADKAANQNKPEFKQFGQDIYRIEGGNIAPVQRVEKSAQEKALTADQSNAAGFADRMDNAEKVLSNEKFAPFIMGTTGTENAILGKIPMVGAKWQDAEYKQFQRAKKDFITAVLRKESGASISPTEFQNEDEKYFPQPWDDPQTIQDKAQARQIAISSMRRAGGPAQPGVAAQGHPSAGGKPIPADVLDQAKAAIVTKGRDAVIKRLQEGGFDTSGL
jgi:hypothetical protein